ILNRLRDSENPFVERKVGADIRRDTLKTAVAFANSLPIGVPGVLFVPVYDDGRVQPDQNLESLQQTISELIAPAYPPIAFLPKVLGTRPEQFLAVLIWGSSNRPHFAGPSYIRDGAVTRAASESEFSELIAGRSSKVYEILSSRGQPVSLTRFRMMGGVRHAGAPIEANVVRCDLFSVTLLMSNGQQISHSMDRVTLNRDDERGGRLWIEAEILA